MKEPTMMRTKGDGVEIQLAVWEGPGIPVICVHGLTANCRCWDVMAQSVADRHRVLALDLRGRGLSDKPATGYSEAHHIRDLKCVMDDLRLEKAFLMGHSLGGYIAMGFAATNPERVAGLILIDAGGELSQKHWERVTAAIKPSIDRLEMTFPSVDAFLELMKKAPFLQPWSDNIETYFRYDLVKCPEGFRSRIQPEHIREEMTNKRGTPVGQYYRDLRCPVMILRATDGILVDDDILLPADSVAKMLSEIPHARLVDITGTNHYSILFQPNSKRDSELLAFLGS